MLRKVLKTLKSTHIVLEPMYRRPTAGFVLSLIAGVFIVLNAALLSLAHVFAFFYFAIHSSTMWSKMFTLTPWLPLFLSVFGALCGALVLLGSYYLYKGRNTLGGVLVLVFSVLSLPIGGGFIIGFLLGVIGGALALANV